MNGDDKPTPSPRCMHEVIQRVGQGTSTKDDADYLLDTLAKASARIRALERRVAMLQRRVATVH